MKNIIIFGGTTEGRLLAEFCEKNGIYARISSATEYGSELIHSGKFVTSVYGRMDCGEMREYFICNNIDTVIDATHPYAVEVTKNIKNACGEDINYIRLARSRTDHITGITAKSISEAVHILNKSRKKALITTGGKNVAEYTAVNDFRERLAVRLLPAEGIIEKCVGLGFKAENIIAEKGPFSVEQNISHIKRFESELLVTKESGAAGGYGEKIKAAELCGIETITILRPAETGYSLEQAEDLLAENFGKERR